MQCVAKPYPNNPSVSLSADTSLYTREASNHASDAWFSLYNKRQTAGAVCLLFMEFLD